MIIKNLFARVSFSLVFTILFFSGCEPPKSSPVKLSQVTITDLLTDSISIRAIAPGNRNLAFAGSNGYYGLYDARTGKTKVSRQLYDSIVPAFRAVAFTDNDFFMLSIGTPALLYKTGTAGKMELVYREDGENVFYDAMQFWNEKEGIAIGDPTDGCMSVIITRDGGFTWKKLECESLPLSAEGEAAFAASNTNIAIVGDKAWIASGGIKSRIYYSPDKGRSWEVFNTPFTQQAATKGIYSIDFYDENLGFAIGGDYTDPSNNEANKAITRDGGRSWELVANKKHPGYKSCVQFVPGSLGASLVAVGFTGISVSNDYGENWNELSKEGFYTLRFINDSTAYAAGKNRLSKLVFK
ncbi:WD40/YVTN/BNR-like repeat-containing protein [Flavobacteriaceae bacterium M23B6Z8]